MHCSKTIRSNINSNIASLLYFKCPEDECNLTISGANTAECKEIMLFHKDLSHRKSFECTQFGRMPPEIMLKILGYVVQDCKKCFLQRDLLRVGSVCKKLNQLTKTQGLVKSKNPIQFF